MKKINSKFLHDVGTNVVLREKLIGILVEYEKEFQSDNGYNIREEITGPIVDDLFLNSNEVFISKVQDEIQFKYTYKSKIMRDFILRHEKCPDHFWEPQTTKLLKMLSKTSKNVFVGGAYIGDHVVYIAKELLEKNGKCHTFEPNTDSFNLLKENCKLNKLDNVVFNNKGLWYENKKLVFVGDDSHASSQELNSDSETGFDAVSINNYCKDQNVATVDLIMLDLEGGELNVLKGASDYLSLDKNLAPIIIYEIHSSYSDWSNGLEKSEICSYLIDNGYSLYSIRDFQSNYPMKNKKIELIPVKSTIIDGPSHGFNMIALKDKSILNNENIVLCENVSPKLLLHRDKKLHSPIS
jgi:FkbM family methyltransferase